LFENLNAFLDVREHQRGLRLAVDQLGCSFTLGTLTAGFICGWLLFLEKNMSRAEEDAAVEPQKQS